MPAVLSTMTTPAGDAMRYRVSPAHFNALCAAAAAAAPPARAYHSRYLHHNPRKPRLCHYCTSHTHVIRTCPMLPSDRATGHVSTNSKGHVCLPGGDLAPAWIKGPNVRIRLMKYTGYLMEMHAYHNRITSVTERTAPAMTPPLPVPTPPVNSDAGSDSLIEVEIYEHDDELDDLHFAYSPSPTNASRGTSPGDVSPFPSPSPSPFTAYKTRHSTPQSLSNIDRARSPSPYAENPEQGWEELFGAEPNEDVDLAPSSGDVTDANEDEFDTFQDNIEVSEARWLAFLFVKGRGNTEKPIIIF
ncbi:hypothetical protein C8F01DRAFT_1263715 [Mycena amicta]|nr:hypothetical protein C8F01DRAFT_1263715 [Mycena amicta]